MSNQEWGVTERGFHRPTYVELLDAIEYPVSYTHLTLPTTSRV